MTKTLRLKFFKEMIESCFTYGNAGRDSYQFKTYIQPYEKELGKKLFDEVYESHLQYLKANFRVEKNVYVDSEGVTYNSLKPLCNLA